MTYYHPFHRIPALVLLGLLLSLAPRALAASEESLMALSRLAENTERITLPNGLRILLYRRGAAPVFAGALVVQVGSVDEVPGKTGISHMFEHMAFKGTKTVGVTDAVREASLLREQEEIAQRNPVQPERDPRWAEILSELERLWVNDAYSREYQRRGAVGLNASTGSDFTQYYVNMPRSALRFWCFQEADRLLNPVMRQFYKERAVVMEEWRWRFVDDPLGRLYLTTIGQAFEQHPYRLPTIGYEGDLRRITASDVETFRRRYYVPANMVVSLVGDVDSERDGDLLRECFGRLPVGPPVERTHLVEPPQLGEREFVLNLDAAPSLALAYHKPVFPNADDAAITVLEEILARGRTGRLYERLVKEKELAVAASYSEGPGTAYPNLSIFIVSVREPNDPHRVLREFEQVMHEVRTHGVTAAEVDVARRGLSMSYLSSLDSNQSVATDLASNELVYGDFRVGLTWFDQLSRVTPADVQRVANDYFKPAQRTVGIIRRKARGVL